MSAHLTDQQIQDLLQKRMDPDGQLACMEHMGVCEDCMLRYADRVEAAYSIDPPRGMAEEILSHSRGMVRQDTQPDAAQQGAVRRTVTRRVTVRSVIALAASLAIAVSLWFGGVFTQVRDIDKVAMQYTGEIRQTIDQQREKKEMERYYKFVNGEDMKDAKK